MLPTSLTPNMDKFSHGIMKAIVGKALTKRYVPNQGSERTPQKSLRGSRSNKDLRHTDFFTLERSAPICIPGAKESLDSQRHRSGSTVKAKTARTAPEIEWEIPFPQFLTMSSHHAHPQSNMDHDPFSKKPLTPPCLIRLAYKSQEELQEEKHAEAMELLKRRAIRRWKKERTKSFPPPRFAPPTGYSYGPEDFEFADDFDRIMFLPLEAEPLNRYWEEDLVFRMASAKSDKPTRQNIGSSTHRQLFRVKADVKLKASEQKRIQWAHNLEKPKRPERHMTQEPNLKRGDLSVQPSAPKGIRLQVSEVGEASSSAAEAPQTRRMLEASTEEPHESADRGFYSSEGSYEGSDLTDDDSDYYDEPSSDLHISRAESSSSREKGKARLVDV